MPNQTEILTHFTKNTQAGDAKQNLESILQGTIRATPNGWFKHIDKQNSKCVCFTEISLHNIEAHVREYSMYGIVFPKEYIIETHGGNPIFYMTGDMTRRQTWDDSLKPFVDDYTRGGWAEKWVFHEKEWRVPHDVSFSHSNALMVLVPSTDLDYFRQKFPNIRTFFPTEWFGYL